MALLDAANLLRLDLLNSTCTFGCGVVYEYSAKGKYSVIYSFTGADDGFNPSFWRGQLGLKYGAVLFGGSGNGNGIIYKITP